MESGQTPPPGGQPHPRPPGPIDLPGTHRAPPSARPPAPVPEPERDDSPPPEPEVYGPAPDLSETLEATLRASFQPDLVFAAFRDREAPDYFTLLLNAMSWAFIGELVFLAAAYVLSPSLADMGVLPILLGAAGGLIVSIPLSFAAAAALHGLSLLAGAKGDYNRTYQLLSLMGGVLPASAVLVLVPVPFAWIVPTIYASWLAVRGVEILHRCYGTQVLSTVGLAGLAATALQAASHGKIETLQRDLATRATLLSTRGTASSPSESGGPPASSLAGPAPSAMTFPRGNSAHSASPGMGMGRPLGASLSAETAAPAEDQGSLGMVRRDSGQGELRQPEPMSYDMGGAPRARGVPEGPGGQPQSIAQTVLNMLNQQLSDNPEAMRKMSPEQRAQLEKMLKKANEFSRQAGSGGLQDEETQRMLQDMTTQLRGAQNGSVKRRRPKSKPSAIPAPDDNPFASDGQ